MFVVDVTAQTPAALQQAMRAALVRATGRQEAATDAVFASLVAAASQYVAGYQRGPQGELQVAFNGAAVDHAIAALGRSVWNADRPFTLIVLSPPPSRAEQAADHAALEQGAEARGLPISIVPLPVRDAGGNLLQPEALLALVHQFGAEQLLVGHPDAAAATVPAAPAGSALQPSPAVAAAAAGTPPAVAQQWRWTLVTAFMRRTFTGPITAGIDGTVDLLAPSPQAASGEQAGEVRVHIEGIATLDDYARVELMLAAMPGVSRSDVARLGDDTAVFDLQARGGAAAVIRTLADSPRFRRIDDAGGNLRYRYLPASPRAPQPAATHP